MKPIAIHAFDASGNLAQDDLYKYKLDAENRLVELRNLSNTLLASYAGVYPERIRPERTSRRDGNSIRVIKVAGSTRTWYLYAGTQLIGEFTDTASNTYSAGTLPGQAGSDSTATMLFQHPDHLTTRLTSDNFSNTGNQQAHYPYGENWYATGTADPSVKRKFTSYYKEDEAATGKLNYAVFREQSSRVGRFLMADPVQGNAGNPQRLNRYAYVTNNPANFRDPKGLEGGGDGLDYGITGPGAVCDINTFRCKGEEAGLSGAVPYSGGGGGFWAPPGTPGFGPAGLPLPTGVGLPLPTGGGLDGGDGGGGIPVCFETGRVAVSNSRTFIGARSLGCNWVWLRSWVVTGRSNTCRCAFRCNTQTVAYDFRNRTDWEVTYVCGDGRSTWTETRPERTTTVTTEYRIEPTWSDRVTTTEGFIFTTNPLNCACPWPPR